jgi:hypothetical protein
VDTGLDFENLVYETATEVGVKLLDYSKDDELIIFKYVVEDFDPARTSFAYWFIEKNSKEEMRLAIKHQIQLYLESVG